MAILTATILLEDWVGIQHWHPDPPLLQDAIPLPRESVRSAAPTLFVLAGNPPHQFRKVPSINLLPTVDLLASQCDSICPVFLAKTVQMLRCVVYH